MKASAICTLPRRGHTVESRRKKSVNFESKLKVLLSGANTGIRVMSLDWNEFLVYFSAFRLPETACFLLSLAFFAVFLSVWDLKCCFLISPLGR